MRRAELNPLKASALSKMAREVTDHIVKRSGIPWKVTSVIREGSLTHTRGDAWDVAPLRFENGEWVSTVRENDPMFSYDPSFAMQLDDFLQDAPYTGFALIENDHVHLVLGKWMTKGDNWRVAVQRDIVGKYPDSAFKKKTVDGTANVITPAEYIVTKGGDGHWNKIIIEY